MLFRSAEKTPLIVPIWIKGKVFICSFTASLNRSNPGFEEVMHESRTFPRMMPRSGKNVTIVIGDPINHAVEPLINDYRAKHPTPWRPTTYSKDVGDDLKDEPAELAGMRVRMAEVMREMLLKLGGHLEEAQKLPPLY